MPSKMRAIGYAKLEGHRLVQPHETIDNVDAMFHDLSCARPTFGNLHDKQGSIYIFSRMYLVLRGNV